MTRTRLFFFFCAWVLASLAFMAEAQGDASASAPVTFAGKTVTILAGGGPGGAYDLYSRLFAAHLGNHLPGKPRVIVENMGAAGGLPAANYLYHVAPRDGTYLGMISQTAAIGQAVQVPGIRYDVRKFNWIGRLTSNDQVLQTWHTSKVKKFADVLKYPVIIGGTGPTSSSVVFPKIMDDELGTKFKLVPGFPGMTAAVLAMESGEVEAVVRPWADVKTKNPNWITDHIVNPIVQFSITRDPELANVPAIVDLAKTPAQRQLFAFFASGDDIGDAIVAPPHVPAATVAVLRAAYRAVIKDPAFLADAHREKSEIKPLDGASLTKLNDDVFTTPPAIVKLAMKYSGVRRR